MDESLQELENELKALAPRRAPEAWLERINRDLAAEMPATPPPRYTSATNLSSWKWFGWRTAGLAAALALVAVVGYRQVKPASPSIGRAELPSTASAVTTPSPDAYQPVVATNVLYDLKDEGPVTVEGDPTARQVRARYVDTYTWKNPRNNSSLKWSVPREEVRVLPASYVIN